MKTVNTPINKIKPYVKNPRHNQDAIDQVAQSIKNYNFVQPIVVDKKNVIIIGHTRLLAAQQLGMKTVPVVFATDLSPKQVKALRIADNKVGEKATWDFDLLKDELTGLDNFFTGFDGDELNSVLGDIESVGFPELNSGDKGELEQITFTLHKEQAEIVREAIDDILNSGDTDDSLNDNKNGNAIAGICSWYMQSE